MAAHTGEKQKKADRKFTWKMKKKLFVLFGGVLLCLCALVVRLFYIDFSNGESYKRVVLAQQAYDSTTLPFQRGSIVDAHGITLATSMAVYNVVVDAYLVNYDYNANSAKEEEDRIDYVGETLDALDACFGDCYVMVGDQPMDRGYIKSYIQTHPDSRYLVVAEKLSYEQVQEFMQLEEENDAIVGVWFEKEYERTYPYKTLASAILGFVSDGNVGTTGLENYYDDVLNGTNGREYGYLNSDKDYEKTIISAQDGDTLLLSVDVNIQSIVEEKIQEFNDALKNNYREGDGSYNTAVLIMDPNNGEILAMADYPSYDCNAPRDLSGLYSEEEIEALSDEETLDILNQLWQNFCVSGTYEPGSVQKALTISCGLETGTLNTDMTFFCDGSEVIGGSTIHCVNRNGHGTETLRGALMDSCNDSLMQMSYLIGIDNFTHYQSVFNMGQKTGIDLPGEASASTLIYTADTMTKIDLATNSFGQNYNCTMIQMAAAYASIINGGYYCRPHVVKKILDASGNTLSRADTTPVKQTISKSTSDILRSYLTSVVTDGTGRYGKVDGYSMGGKTGTAEKTENGTKSNVDYLVSYIAFTPVENPQLLIYVIVDSPNVQDQSHSSYAQHLAREILEEVLPYLNFYPDEELTGVNKNYDIVGNIIEADDTADVPLQEELDGEAEEKADGQAKEEAGEAEDGQADGGESAQQADEPGV